MTKIEQQAMELLNGPESPYYYNEDDHPVTVLARAIEQHEQFKREVSDAVHKHWGDMPCEFDRFILPKPVDPLVEAMIECGFGDSSNAADDIRSALAKRGGKIVWETSHDA